MAYPSGLVIAVRDARPNMTERETPMGIWGMSECVLIARQAAILHGRPVSVRSEGQYTWVTFDGDGRIIYDVRGGGVAVKRGLSA